MRWAGMRTGGLFRRTRCPLPSPAFARLPGWRVWSTRSALLQKRLVTFCLKRDVNSGLLGKSHVFDPPLYPCAALVICLLTEIDAALHFSYIKPLCVWIRTGCTLTVPMILNHFTSVWVFLLCIYFKIILFVSRYHCRWEKAQFYDFWGLNE